MLGQAVAGSGSSNAGVTQVNKGFDAHYDARASYVNRSTRWMPWVGLAIGVLVGVFGVRRRRLEYAGALHSGQSKGAQLLGIGVETGVWAGLATFASCALLLAYAVRMSRSDWAAVLAAAGIAVVPFLQEALTGLKKRNNPLGFWLVARRSPF